MQIFHLIINFFCTYKGDEDEEDKKASEEELAKDLHVVSVDVKITENCEKHRTAQYSCTKARKNQDGVSLPPELVVRRGQPFRITVKFNQPFLKEKHGMQIIFITGKNKIKCQNIWCPFIFNHLHNVTWVPVLCCKISTANHYIKYLLDNLILK